MYFTLAVLLATAFWLGHALRRKSAELDLIGKHAPAAMAHVVRSGDRLYYRFVNESYAALYGKSKNDVIGRSPANILGPEVYARSKTNMDRALRGETVTFSLLLEDVPVEVTYSPVLGRGGKAKGFVAVIRRGALF